MLDMDKKNEKIIYKIYKDFYKKEPNFDKENLRNITIEIQSMLYILKLNHIDIFCEGFSREYIDLELPMNMTVQDIIVGRLIGNNEDLSDSSLHFNDISKMYIDRIGFAVTEFINSFEDPIETLRLMSYLSFFDEQVYSFDVDDFGLDDIEYIGCKMEDIQNYNKLYLSILKETKRIEEIVKDTYPCYYEDWYLKIPLIKEKSGKGSLRIRKKKSK